MQQFEHDLMQTEKTMINTWSRNINYFWYFSICFTEHFYPMSKNIKFKKTVINRKTFIQFYEDGTSFDWGWNHLIH